MYVLSLFFAVLLGVGLHCFLGVPASMNDVRPRGVRVVCRLLVMSTLVMLGRSPACNGDLDTGTPNDSARGCMAQRGYTLVRRDQAENVRAAYAAGAQRAVPNR